MTYRSIENAPPGKKGITTETVFDDDNATFSTVIRGDVPRPSTVDPYYTIIVDDGASTGRQPTAPTPIVVNTSVQSASATQTARYESTATVDNITSRTLLTNNGFGPSTFSDINPVIWDTGNNKINVYNQKDIIELQIRFRAETDTLGGAFEVELETILTSTVIDTQEYNINIQEQDYTVTFKVITAADDITNGISIYVKPELGMTLNLSNIEFVFIRTTQLA